MTACLAAACGPSDEMVAVDIVYSQDGQGRALKTASVIHVVSEGTHWQATHAAGITPSISPDDPMAMSYCQVVSGGARHSTFADFEALELGEVTISRAERELDLERVSPRRGMGAAYVSEIDAALMDFEPSEEHLVSATGEAGPAFSVGVISPEDFQLVLAAGAAPGPGPIPVARDEGLRVSWSPRSDDTEMFMAIESSSSEAVICRVRDDGDFTIAAGVMELLSAGQATLVLERYSEQRFETERSPAGAKTRGRARFSLQRVQRIELRD